MIPFVEGVLNAREEKEVRDAIQADPVLAREIQELREVVDELRVAFASGIQPSQPELTPEEVVELAAHDGKLETMPGGSELKTRLFTSDQALEEYRLLQQLREEAANATIDLSDVPPMPESLLEEFRKLKEVEQPKVVPLIGRPSLWKRSMGYLDRINPKPLMAAAAAFAVVSLGLHISSTSTSIREESHSAGMVSYADSGREAPAAAASPASETTRPDPSGVTVFTSSDKKLLREQAQKLLSKDIRYTVADDRIIVSEKEIGAARKVLWGEDGEQTVAVAEETKKERLRNSGEQMDEGLAAPHLEPPGGAARDVAPSEQEGSAGASPMRLIDMRDKGAEKDPVVEPDTDFSQPPKPRSDASAAPALTSQARPPGASGSLSYKASNNETPEERRERLKRLALGESVQDSSQISVTRSRTAPPVPAVERPAPVPNAVTAPSTGDEPGGDGSIRESRPGTVAVNPVEGAPAPSTVDIDRIEVKSDSSAESATAPYIGVVGSSAPRKTAAQSAPSAAAQQPEANGLLNSQRLAAIRDAQPAVARKYNVVLSVEQRGSQINVYVRPKGELDKNQLDELRRAIRSELGLDEADSIIFQ